MFQPLPRSQGVLAHGHVCKPFAHECWLIRHERWPKGSCIRTDRWPTHALVCKPEGYCSQAATAMGVPMTETFLREHRESISCCFIEAGRAGVRLPAGVQLPPLPMAAGDNHLAAGDNHLATGDNGAAPPTTILTAAELPTSIPAGLQLPCAEALISDLRPPQLSLLIGKVGLRALTDKSLEPLHVALLAERARRFEHGRKPTPEAHGDIP
jgi:hypothetical protein